MRKEIICYSAKKTPRLYYTLDLLFADLMACDYALTDDLAEFGHWREKKQANTRLVYCFYYADAPIIELEQYGIDFLPASGLLWATDIRPQDIKMTTWADLPVGFALDISAALPFDLLAWVFYLVSRYEEYLPYQKDAHGRFSATQSIAQKHNFLRQPLINQLAMAWDSHIARQQVGWQVRNIKNAYYFVPSYDIDYMFAYRAKGFFRQIGGLFRAVLKLDFQQIVAKIQVWTGQKSDPFDTFAYLDQLHQKYQLNKGGNTPFYFFLIGDWGKYDKNIQYNQPLFSQIVVQIDKKYNVGLHPSYASNDMPENTRLRLEKKRLDALLSRPIMHSRQHFLRLNLPDTYQRLLSEAIYYDFSMGYADALGFRASIATPFAWFDLSSNQKTDLIVVPFALMDVTLKDYLGLSPAQADSEIAFFIKQYKSVGGYFVSLWHNSSFGEVGGWGADWRRVYEQLLAEATGMKND
jgi:hypothetical protein